MERDIKKVDDDVVFSKREIIRRICADKDLIEALHNPNLDPESPEDYLGVNIFPYLKVPDTQETVKNYICFAVNDVYPSKENKMMKQQQVQFAVFCHVDDMDTPYGIMRHDLIAYILRDLFNWSNLLGMQLKLIYNMEDTRDNNYPMRTLKFEAIKPNSPQRGVMTNRFEF